MTQKFIEEVHELRGLGFSIRETARELGASKSSIERALKETPTRSGAAGADTPGRGASAPAADTSLERQRHELEKKRLELQERELALREAEARNRPTLQGVMTATTDTDERQKKRADKRKAMLAEKHNDLVNELLDNTTDAVWESREIEQLLDRAAFLQQQIRQLCDANDVDEASLKIWDSQQQLAAYLTKMHQAASKNKFVNWDNEPEEDDQIRAWLVDDFEDITGTKNEATLLAEVNNAIRYFQEKCQEDWDKSEVNTFVSLLKETKEEIADYCETYGLDADTLLVTARLDELLNIVDGAKKRDRKSAVVSFGYSYSQEKALTELLVQDFNDERDEEEEGNLAGTDEELAGDDKEESGSGGNAVLVGLAGLAGLALLSRK